MSVERVETLRVVSCLFEDMRYLRQCQQTRLSCYSVQFLLDIRKELQSFSDDLGVAINKKMREQTGDNRPLVSVESWRIR